MFSFVCQAVNDPGISCPGICGRTVLTGSHVPDPGLVPQVANFRTVAVLAMGLKKILL
jgi:hypothetical protein